MGIRLAYARNGPRTTPKLPYPEIDVAGLLGADARAPGERLVRHKRHPAIGERRGVGGIGDGGGGGGGAGDGAVVVAAGVQGIVLDAVAIAAAAAAGLPLAVPQVDVERLERPEEVRRRLNKRNQFQVGVA